MRAGHAVADLEQRLRADAAAGRLGLDGSEHPAGLIDLSPISPDANQYPTVSFDALCLSIINNCFTSWPYICTTVKLLHRTRRLPRLTCRRPGVEAGTPRLPDQYPERRLHR